MSGQRTSGAENEFKMSMIASKSFPSCGTCQLLFGGGSRDSNSGCDCLTNDIRCVGVDFWSTIFPNELSPTPNINNNKSRDVN